MQLREHVAPEASSSLSLSTVFKISGLLGSQVTKAFYILTCAGLSSCSSKGFTQWLLDPSTFTHPYQWHWSWIQYPQGYWYIAAPYSYLWYGLNFTAIFGFLPWMFSLWAVDTAASYFVIRNRSWPFIVTWLLSSQFFLNYDGIDYFVFLFSSFGFISPLFSILALVVKLPIGAPGYVWGFVLSSPVSTANWINWPRYAWLGAWWIVGVAMFSKKHPRWIANLIKRTRKAILRLPTGLSHNT